MTIEGVRFYYVFSFGLSRLPLKEQITANDVSQATGAWLASTLQRSLHYVQDSVQWHQSEEQEPHASRSSLYVPFQHLSISTRAERVEFENIGSGQLSTHIAVFESGMGVLWVLAEPDNVLDCSQLVTSCSRTSLPVVLSTDQNSGIVTRRSLHGVFSSEVLELCDQINGALKELGPDNHRRLLDACPGVASYGAGQPPTAHNLTSGKEFTVSWLDAGDPSLWWHDESDGDSVFQEPCTAVIVKVDESARDLVDHPRTPGREDLEQLISSILHGNSSEYLDHSHCRDYSGRELQNLYPDRRFRTFLHENCLLVLHSEDLQSQSSKDFLAGLFRTYCAIRGCWHMYSLVNERLDRSINSLFCQFQRMVRSSVDTSSLLAKQEEVIEARGSFLVSLAFEDPLVRAIGLTPYGPLYEAGSGILRLRELRELVQYKLRELDHLHEMITSYLVRCRYEMGNRGAGSLAPLLYGTVFLVLAAASIIFLPSLLGTRLIASTIALTFGAAAFFSIVPWAIKRIGA